MLELNIGLGVVFVIVLIAFVDSLIEDRNLKRSDYRLQKCEDSMEARRELYEMALRAIADGATDPAAREKAREALEENR